MNDTKSKSESKLNSSFEDAERSNLPVFAPPPFDIAEDVRTIFREWRKIVAADKAARTDKLKP